MKLDIDILGAVLTESVKRNGTSTPLTIGHLRNIIKMVKRVQLKEERREELNHRKLVDEVFGNGQH